MYLSNQKPRIFRDKEIEMHMYCDLLNAEPNRRRVTSDIERVPSAGRRTAKPRARHGYGAPNMPERRTSFTLDDLSRRPVTPPLVKTA